MGEALRDLGRQPVLVPASAFWRPAGERFTYGREDWQAFRDSWLDHGALRREVLSSGEAYLPALWDVERDRSARLTAVPLPPRAVVLVHGLFLAGLTAALTVHVALSPAALRRRGVPEWQLDAFSSYEVVADVLVRAEDPLRPAVSWPASR